MTLKAILTAVVLACTAASASAITPVTPYDYINNGSFTETTGGQDGGIGQLNYKGLTATGWTSGPAVDGSGKTAFNFLLDPTTADTAGFVSENSPTAHTNIFLWGPGKNSYNGLTASKDGGKVFGSDGGYIPGRLQQQITGLQVNHDYQLTFEWAAGQFTDEIGDTESQWQVSFLGETVQTGIVKNPGKGFQAWRTYSKIFHAGSVQDTLSFLALGTPAGAPPFAMLDGVHLIDVTAVPEPQTWGMLGAGLALVAAMARRKKKVA